MESRGSGLILGGGIAGLALSAALRRGGVDARLFEAAPELRASGTGLVLGPSALKALAVLGLRDEALGLGVLLADGGITDLQLRPLGIEPFAHFSAQTGEPFLGIERSALVRLLAGASHACQTNKRYVALKPSSTGMEATFADGERIDASWVVCADGIRSSARINMLGGRTRDSGQRCWRGVADFGMGALSHSFREAWGSEWSYGFVGVGSGRAYWWVTRQDAAAAGQMSRIATRRPASWTRSLRFTR